MIGCREGLGMRSGDRRIFLWRAAFVTLRGLVGHAVGLGLCLIQKWTHLVKPSGGLPAPGGARVAGVGLVAAAERRVHRRDRRPCW